MHDVYNVLRTNANHHYIFIMIVNVKSTTTRGMLLEWCRRVKYVVHWKGFFFQVVARFVWRIIIDDVSINRQWEVRMGVQKTITENPLHSSLCYIPLWSLFSLHTILVISFTTGLKRCNSCLKTMTVHLKTLIWAGCMSDHILTCLSIDVKLQYWSCTLCWFVRLERGNGTAQHSSWGRSLQHSSCGGGVSVLGQEEGLYSTTQFLYRWCFSIKK